MVIWVVLNNSFLFIPASCSFLNVPLLSKLAPSYSNPALSVELEMAHSFMGKGVTLGMVDNYCPSHTSPFHSQRLVNAHSPCSSSSLD